MSKRASLFLVPVLVLAACGGGDDDAGAGSVDDWCALAQRIEDSSDRYDGSFEAGGEALGEAFTEFAELLNDAKGSAPNEIRDAVDTAAKGIERFGELLEEVDYDLFEMDEASFAELEQLGEEMDPATDQIEAYNLRECGIGESPDDSASSSDNEIMEDPSEEDTTADEAEDVLVTFTGDPNSAWCVTSRELSLANDAFEDVLFAEPDILEAAYTEMMGMYEAAATLAPPELVDDVAVSLSTINRFQAALEAADYDFLNVDLSALDNDEAGEIANNNIEAYNEQVCGITDDADDAEDTTDDDGNGFDAGAGTVRDQAVRELVESGFTEQEASCIFDNIDFTDPDLGTDASAIIAVFDSCQIDLARLAELGG